MHEGASGLQRCESPNIHTWVMHLSSCLHKRLFHLGHIMCCPQHHANLCLGFLEWSHSTHDLILRCPQCPLSQALPQTSSLQPGCQNSERSSTHSSYSKSSSAYRTQHHLPRMIFCDCGLKHLQHLQMPPRMIFCHGIGVPMGHKQFLHASMCTYACAHVHVWYICTHTCIYIYIHTHLCIYVYIYHGCGLTLCMRSCRRMLLYVRGTLDGHP